MKQNRIAFTMATLGVAFGTFTAISGCGTQTSEQLTSIPTTKQPVIVPQSQEPKTKVVSDKTFISEAIHALPEDLAVPLMAPTVVPKTSAGMVLSARAFDDSGYVVQFYQAKEQYPVNHVNTVSAQMIATFGGWSESSQSLLAASGYANPARPKGLRGTFKTGAVKLADSLPGTYYIWDPSPQKHPVMPSSSPYYGIYTSYESWKIQVNSNNQKSPVAYANQLIEYLHQHGLPHPRDKGYIVMTVDHPAYKLGDTSVDTVVAWKTGNFVYNTTFGSEIQNPNPWYFGIKLAASMRKTQRVG